MTNPRRQTTFGKLHEFWSSNILNDNTKLRLYKCAVWSQITYGMIAWKLTEKTCRFLANWNAKNFARITDRKDDPRGAEAPNV